MPDSSLFQLIQERFNQFYVQEYGQVTHFYSMDTFNEMSPPSGESTFLANYGENVIKSLTNIDPEVPNFEFYDNCQAFKPSKNNLNRQSG